MNKLSAMEKFLNFCDENHINYESSVDTELDTVYYHFDESSYNWSGYAGFCFGFTFNRSTGELVSISAGE